MSLDLLSVLADREQWNRFHRYIKGDVLPKEISQVMKDIKDFYTKHPDEEDIDWERFSEWFCLVKHGDWKPDKLEVYQRLFDRLSDHEETCVAEAIIEKYIKQEYSALIADIALKGAEGNEIDFGDIISTIDELNVELGVASEEDDYVVSTDLAAIVEEMEASGLKWRMSFLNKSIGDLLPERFVCVSARPGTGKTTFLASEASFMAEQLPDDRPVLWINNEESGGAVFLRIVQATLQTEEALIRANPVQALDDYAKKVGHKDKVVVINKADATVSDIEAYCKKYNPGLIIIDQLWKVHGFEKSSGTDTARLGAIYRWGREIAKKYAPVITVHQLKTEADFVEYVPLSMLYLSGTIIQGEVDNMICIGANNKPGQEKYRFINIAKSKAVCGSEVDPLLRDGKQIVEIVPDKATYQEAELL